MNTKKKVICQGDNQLYRFFINWNPGGERNFFQEELIKEFSLEKNPKSAGIFNTERLDWYNREYMKNRSLKKLGNAFEIFIKLACRTGKLEKKTTENFFIGLK